MKTIYPVTLDKGDFEDVENAEELIDAFQADAQHVYDLREEAFGEENMRELERQVWLTVLDRKWREHLYEMDYLREGIGLRAMAQRDPLVEYKREGADMFDAMRDGFAEEVVGHLFNLDLHAIQRQTQPQIMLGSDGRPVDVDSLVSGAASAAGESATADPEAAEEIAGPTDEPEPAAPQPKRARVGKPARRAQQLSYSAPGEDGEAQQTSGPEQKSSYEGIGRNQPCPCGSGKKFKLCHGRNPNAA